MYIRADGWDDSKYVKIGNLMLPTDTSGYGNMTAEQISDRTKREYQQELDRQAAEKKKQEEAERGMAVYEQAFANVDPAQRNSDQFETLVDALNIGDGPCNNIGAELVRAMHELLKSGSSYDEYFYEGDSYDEYGSFAAFIADHAGESIYDAIFSTIGEDGSSYDLALERICDRLVDYLREHPEIFGQETEDSSNYDSRTLRRIEEEAPEYEFDFETSDVAEYVDRGCIDWSDFEEWVEGLDVFWHGDCTLEPNYSDSYVITNLTREQYRELEDYFADWYQNYLEDLCDTYTDGDYYNFIDQMEWARFIAFLLGNTSSHMWGTIYEELKANQFDKVLNSLAERDASYGIDDYEDIVDSFKEFFDINSEDDEDEE